MLRVVATIVLPLVLPTAIYLFWVQLARRSQRVEGVRWAALPWVWLAGAGALLLGFVLFVVTVGFGTSEPGTYVPPRWENGRIIPGHIEPHPRP
jgi:uncharacterized protein DUF6111